MNKNPTIHNLPDRMPLPSSANNPKFPQGGQPLPSLESPADKVLDRFIEYFNSTWTSSTILSAIGQVAMVTPLALPSPLIWKVPKGISANLGEIVQDFLPAKRIRETYWPILQILMNDNIGNFHWTANVLVYLALHDVIKTLPLRVNNG